MIQGIVEGTIRLLGCDERAISRLDRETSFAHPAYVRAKRLGREPWGLPERYHVLVERPDGSCELPRGCVEIVRAVLGREKCAIEWRDRRSMGDAIVCPKGPSLRDYQAHGVRCVQSLLQGVISLPCGTGKTRLGVGCIAAISRATLVIVHTGDLGDQWAEDVANYTGLRAGRFDADRAEIDAPVVIASVFTLAPFLATEEGQRWVRRFGLVIVDEAHHAPAETFQLALALIPARYRVGLTATPTREDGLTDLVFWGLGPMLLEKSTREMIARGYLMHAEIVDLVSELRFDPHAFVEKKRMGALDLAIESDPARNALIADIAAREGTAGEWCFVLVQRKAHAFALARMIYERGCPCLALTGAGGKRAKASRKLALEAMRDGRGEHVLIGTSLLDEGVNVPRLSRLFLAYPAKAEGALTQRTGRVIRDFDKKPRIYDVIDPHVSTLVRRAAERRRVFHDLGIAA